MELSTLNIQHFKPLGINLFIVEIITNLISDRNKMGGGGMIRVHACAADY